MPGFFYEREDNDLKLKNKTSSGSKTGAVNFIVYCTVDGTENTSQVSAEPEDAWLWACANLPSTLAGMTQTNVEFGEVVSEGQFIMKAEYATSSSATNGALVNPIVSVTTTGKTERKYYSLQTKNIYFPTDKIFTGSSNESTERVKFGGGINVGENGPEGVDVPARNFAWTEKWYFVKGSVSWDYMQSLGDYTGMINKEEFRGFDAECVMFLGCDCAPESDGDYHVATFSFQYNKGGNEVWVNGFDAFEKSGFDYYWLYSIEAPSGAVKVKKPAQLNVEMVCKPENFTNMLKIGTDLPLTANIPLTGNPIIAS